jgi:hypothetical protein
VRTVDHEHHDDHCKCRYASEASLRDQTAPKASALLASSSPFTFGGYEQDRHHESKSGLVPRSLRPRSVTLSLSLYGHYSPTSGSTGSKLHSRRDAPGTLIGGSRLQTALRIGNAIPAEGPETLLALTGIPQTFGLSTHTSVGKCVENTVARSHGLIRYTILLIYADLLTPISAVSITKFNAPDWPPYLSHSGRRTWSR